MAAAAVTPEPDCVKDLLGSLIMLFIGNQWQYLKLKSVEMQEAAEILEGDTPSAHPAGPDLSVYQPWHQVWIVIIMKTF